MRAAFPDQNDELISLRLAGDDAVITEFWLMGTHKGPLSTPMGEIPPTGKSFKVRMCAVLEFDGEQIICERIYFDAMSLMRQLTRGMNFDGAEISIPPPPVAPSAGVSPIPPKGAGSIAIEDEEAVTSGNCAKLPRIAFRLEMLMTARLALAAFIALIVAPAARANDDAVIGLVVENDSFAMADDGYTSGIKLSYVSRDGVGRRLAKTFLRAGANDRVRYGLAAGQSIFTPDNKRTPLPLPDQRPYAGWLYLEASSFVAREGGALDILKATAGVVGPFAQGEGAQRTLHRTFGAPDILGWDNQLRNEPGLLVSYDRIGRGVRSNGRTAVELRPTAGVSAGNILTEGRAGAMVRIGNKLATSPPPLRVAPSTPSAGYFADGVSWQVYATGQARAVAQNIFLDGNTFRDSLSVDKKTFVGDFEVGFSVSLHAVALSYAQVFRTREFETQSGVSSFGALSLSARF